MNNIPPAFVLSWTSGRVVILCPFPSCDQKLHGHGYSIPTKDHLNSRAAHCYPRRPLQYRILFPYEDDPLVRNINFLLDRRGKKWISVADGLVDPRVDEEEELLCNELAKTQISKTRNQSEEYVLDSKEAQWFLSECTRGDLDRCKRRLEKSDHKEILVKGKDLSDGRTALSLACVEGHLEIAGLLVKHGAGLESFDNDGRTPIMVATANHHGELAYFLAQLGASLFVSDNTSTTLIKMLKAALEKVTEFDMSDATIFIHDSEESSESSDRMYKHKLFLGAKKKSKKGFRDLIDLYMALKPEKYVSTGSSTGPKGHNAFSIVHSNKNNRAQVSFSKTLFETEMGRESKTFAFLDRGELFDHIQAVALSGFTSGDVGAKDGCLDRSLWTSRVMKYCKVVGHELGRVDQNGKSPRRISCFPCGKTAHGVFLVDAYNNRRGV
ncbi:predicted protein [Sclerotinia sclerotiorum 1980 UF-70]|uniref:Uncharacterized protein n=2 Tax=Sclerotinia sclerotiorum (strain ATCC 18683 / 1980 / Ss-1) TaxID=665079 RepID=A7EMV6_SCLS1|nr:predicted protein [Sclerotinia sclerotiorum 1980 UF-70]APA14662.1 hypothetical protein sscle_13g094320 [Sclerotinia sclerotiorum 1980 UF-70]EDO04172.1 predicted protein [Sclerotinia sclerotiorum 1980 UF-70]